MTKEVESDKTHLPKDRRTYRSLDFSTSRAKKVRFLSARCQAFGIGIINVGQATSPREIAVISIWNVDICAYASLPRSTNR